MAACTWGKESVVEFVGFRVSFVYPGAELSRGFFFFFFLHLSAFPGLCNCSVIALVNF